MPARALNGPIDLTVLDVFGRAVQHERLAPTGGDAMFDLGPALGSGAYMVVITSGTERWIERLTVDR